MTGPPDLAPPSMWCPTSWVGDWKATTRWDSSMPKGAEGDPVWIREYLAHDGHEDCCRHTDIVIVERTEVEA